MKDEEEKANEKYFLTEQESVCSLIYLAGLCQDDHLVFKSLLCPLFVLVKGLYACLRAREDQNSVIYYR